MDVTAGRIEIYRDPSAEGYRLAVVHGPGETIHIQAFPDVLIRVEDVFG